MSQDNMWGEEEEAFDDRPEAAQTTIDGKPGVPSAPHQYAPPAIPPRAPAVVPVSVAPVEEEIEYEEQAEASDEDYSDVLTDANLRLEQGSLYKLIMKHELFADVDADPKAIQNVQKAIRKFAREQMEIMLGMRQEAVPIDSIQAASPFNALEVEVLKTLASKATNGATEAEEANQIAQTFKAPRKNTLNSIGGQVPKKKVAAPVVKKPLPTNAATPVQRAKTKLDAIIEQVCREEGIPRELLEENQLLTKPAHLLTAQELVDRSKLVDQRRGAQAKNTQAIPMATPEQAFAVASAQVNNFNGKMDPIMKKLVETVKAMPAKDPFME